MAIVVREMTEHDTVLWDAFVAAHEDGTFCHRAGWKRVIEDGAGQNCPYLLAEEAGQLVGILPLTIRKSLLFGNAAISSMFGVYGGALTSHEAACLALYEKAWQLTQKEGIDVLECRSVKAQHAGTAGWVVPEAKSATFVREIEGDDEALLLSIPRKQRAVIRKGLKNDLVSDWQAGVDEFYALYAHSVHRLGTPVFPKSLFMALLEVFKEDVDIQLIRLPSGEAVASLMSFYDEKTVYPYYAGGNDKARSVAAHDFMYYDLMKRARDRGKKVFDFGRSKIGSGPYSFKKNWGFSPVPLEYEYRLTEGALLPNLSPDNAKFQLMVSAWKKLPLWLANRLGPLIARHLG